MIVLKRDIRFGLLDVFDFTLVAGKLLLDLLDHSLVVFDLLLDLCIGDSFCRVALLPRLRGLIHALLTCCFYLLAQPCLYQCENRGDLWIGLADVPESF